MWQGFKQFILKGNVVDLAVGVVIGASFGSVVTALVKDLINPLIGLLGGKAEFAAVTIDVGKSQFLIGDFINTLISFVINAAVIYFFVVVPMNRLMIAMRKEKPADPTTKKCPECLSVIPIDARRCAFCTTVLSKKS